MNTFEIENVMKNLMSKRFLGVFPSDIQCLPKINTYPSCFISNSDPCHENGTHWIAIYVIDKENAEFFYYFGKISFNQVLEIFKNNKNVENDSLIIDFFTINL